MEPKSKEFITFSSHLFLSFQSPWSANRLTSRREVLLDRNHYDRWDTKSINTTNSLTFTAVLLENWCQGSGGVIPIFWISVDRGSSWFWWHLHLLWSLMMAVLECSSQKYKLPNRLMHAYICTTLYINYNYKYQVQMKYIVSRNGYFGALAALQNASSNFHQILYLQTKMQKLPQTPSSRTHWIDSKYSTAAECLPLHRVRSTPYKW